MAITLDDFNKIWASTSPLTPYSFTEDNYKSGWNFIGSTPPSRQMWDFLQKQNDEKTQWLNDNKLSLSGGTMTGSIILGTEVLASRSVNDIFLQINGGTEQTNGAWLRLNGKDNAGSFQIQANDGTNSRALVGRPTGSLTWNGNNVLTDATVGTVVTKSVSSVSISIPASTATTVTSINLTKGTWVVNGNSRITSVSADKIYGLSITTTANQYQYANDGTVALHSAQNGTIVPNVSNILVLNSSSTVYLCCYATATATISDAHLTAVRIV